MEELKEYANESLYENFRSQKMVAMGGDGAMDNNPISKLEEEKGAHEAKMAKMEAEMRAVFQQKVAEREAKLKQSEDEVGYSFILYHVFFYRYTNFYGFFLS